MLYAMQHLEHEHFRTEAGRNVFVLLERYYNIAADVLPRQTLSDLLDNSSIEAAKSLVYEELFEEVEQLSVADHEFRYGVAMLKDLRAQQLTGEAITSSFEILERGLEVNGEQRKGHREARDYVYSEFAHIDKLDHIESAPEGDMRHEKEQVLQEYADRKAGKTGQGVLTGISAIDQAAGGFQRGELALICAYTGQGKSQLTTQCAWYAAMQQGFNVFFATSETVRATVRRRVIARHSRLPQFECPGGLDTNDIKNGSLDERGEEILSAVVHDLDTNPNYGKVYIAQIPRGANLSFLEARLARQAQQWDVGLAVVDYLALLKPDRKRETSREEYNDILKDSKTMATSFREGLGVPLISPWQMSQNAFKEAQKTGLYGLANLAETSEAEKSPDQIVSLLRMPETPKEATMQFLKLRDGEVPKPIQVEVDYRCAYMGAKDEAGTDEFDLGAFGA